MSPKYSSPRYRNKPHPGRKPLSAQEKRRHLTIRLAPDTHNYLKTMDRKAGLYLDGLIRADMLKRGCGTLDIDMPGCLTEDPQGIILEQARGLIALMIERGTDHLTEEHVEILSNNFSLLINNFVATFKKKPKPHLSTMTFS